MTEPARHDWAKLLQEIMHGGNFSSYKLRTMLFMDYRQFTRLLEGKTEPRHWEGEWILTLHREYGPKAKQSGEA